MAKSEYICAQHAHTATLTVMYPISVECGIARVGGWVRACAAVVVVVGRGRGARMGGVGWPGGGVCEGLCACV